MGQDPLTLLIPPDKIAGYRERDKEIPNRLMALARIGAVNGWDVFIQICGNGVSWRIILAEEHHCVHIRFDPAKLDPARPGLVRNWRIPHRRISTRCPNGDKVHVDDLTKWLVAHPDQCVHDRPPLEQLRGECGGLGHVTPGHDGEDDLS